jgi:hypothetical protein
VLVNVGRIDDAPADLPLAEAGRGGGGGYWSSNVGTQPPAGWAWLFAGKIPGMLQLHLQMHACGAPRTLE